ncbi:MAG: transglutaminase domain-containing protein [Verrucomicrobiales bacterium]
MKKQINTPVTEEININLDSSSETIQNISKYSIIHKTTFSYSEEARENVNQVRLKPLNGYYQNLDFYLLTVLPATKLTEYPDLFGNSVHYFEVNSPHKKLQIESRSTVSIEAVVDYKNLPYGSKHDDLLGLIERDDCYEFLNGSTYVNWPISLWKEALDVKDNSEDVFQTCYSLMTFVYNVCFYCTESTTAETTAYEVFNDKRGVCQDFAHLLIAYCRSIKIPARYVSGYIWDPSGGSGENAMIGSQASHAWVEVYVPNAGWIGLDPTNNKIVNEQYVKIAIGKDYDDVAPIRGTFYGGGKRRTMEVKVDVRNYKK